MHTPAECPDPTCQPCLTLDRNESVVRLELALLTAEMANPDGSWIETDLTVDALDVRNILDLVRGV